MALPTPSGVGFAISILWDFNMGISAYQEVTEWNESEYSVPNHTYLFDGKSNILAYAKASNNEITVFKKPLPLDNRRRKFVKVKHKALDKLEIIVPQKHIFKK